MTLLSSMKTALQRLTLLTFDVCHRLCWECRRIYTASGHTATGAERTLLSGTFLWLRLSERSLILVLSMNVRCSAVGRLAASKLVASSVAAAAAWPKSAAPMFTHPSLVSLRSILKSLKSLPVVFALLLFPHRSSRLALEAI